MRLFLAIVIVFSFCERVAAYELVPIDRIDGDRLGSLSADGRVVAGIDLVMTAEPILWTREGGAISLGQLTGFTSTGAVDVSADGTVITGYGAPGPSEAYRWTQAEGMVGLGPVPGQSGSLAIAVSGDGSTIVGSDGDNTFGFKVGFIWTATEGMTQLQPPFAATGAEARDVSDHGGVVAVATDYITPEGPLEKQRATIWTRLHGFQDLGPLPPGWNSTYPHKLSADGSILLGTASAGGSSVQGTPFLWSQDKGFLPLPMMGGVNLSMTPDASVIVGNQQAGGEWIPLIWDEHHGTRQLHDVLKTDHGFSESELFFNYIRGISADQKTLLVRTATSGFQLWAVYLDKPLVAPIPEPPSWATALVGMVALAPLYRSRPVQRSRD